MADTLTTSVTPAAPAAPAAPSAPATTAPPVWFALPPGFRVLDTRLSRDALTAGVAGLTDGADPRGVAWVEQSVDALARQFEAYRAAGVTFAAHGAHPAPGGGLDLSSLTAAVVPVGDVDHATLVASLLMAESEQEGTTSVVERRIPAGASVLAEREQHSPLATGETLRVIRATIPTPSREHLVVLELATGALHAWDDYRTVFTEMVLPTVTFDDPAVRARRDRATRDSATRLHHRLG